MPTVVLGRLLCLKECQIHERSLTLRIFGTSMRMVILSNCSRKVKHSASSIVRELRRVMLLVAPVVGLIGCGPYPDHDLQIWAEKHATYPFQSAAFWWDDASQDFPTIVRRRGERYSYDLTGMVAQSKELAKEEKDFLVQNAEKIASMLDSSIYFVALEDLSSALSAEIKTLAVEQGIEGGRTFVQLTRISCLSIAEVTSIKKIAADIRLLRPKPSEDRTSPEAVNRRDRLRSDAVLFSGCEDSNDGDRSRLAGLGPGADSARCDKGSAGFSVRIIHTNGRKALSYPIHESYYKSARLAGYKQCGISLFDSALPNSVFSACERRAERLHQEAYQLIDMKVFFSVEGLRRYLATLVSTDTSNPPVSLKGLAEKSGFTLRQSSANRFVVEGPGDVANWKRLIAEARLYFDNHQMGLIERTRFLAPLAVSYGCGQKCFRESWLLSFSYGGTLRTWGIGTSMGLGGMNALIAERVPDLIMLSPRDVSEMQ